MFILDRMMIGGLRFILEQVRNAAESELEPDAETLKRRLIEARMRFEAGEIDEEEFVRQEEAIFAALREARGAGRSAGPISFREDKVDVEVGYDAGDETPQDAEA